MSDDFLGLFMANPVRAKILRLFVFNQSESFTMGRLVQRAGTTHKVAERELNVLLKWGLIKKGKFALTLKSGKVVKGDQKEPTWKINLSNPILGSVSKFVYDASPIHHKHLIETLR